jgi:hypothetical protein
VHKHSRRSLEDDIRQQEQHILAPKPSARNERELIVMELVLQYKLGHADHDQSGIKQGIMLEMSWNEKN